MTLKFWGGLLLAVTALNAALDHIAPGWEAQAVQAMRGPVGMPE